MKKLEAANALLNEALELHSFGCYEEALKAYDKAKEIAFKKSKKSS